MLGVRSEPMQQPAFLNILLNQFKVFLSLQLPNLLQVVLSLLLNPKHSHSALVVMSEKRRPTRHHLATALPMISSSNLLSKTFRTFHPVHPLPQSISSSAVVDLPKISLREHLLAARPHQARTFYPKAFNVKTLKTLKSISRGQHQNRKNWIRMWTRR